MKIGEIYNTPLNSKWRIEIKTSSHTEIVDLDEAEKFASELLNKIREFRKGLDSDEPMADSDFASWQDDPGYW